MQEDRRPLNRRTVLLSLAVLLAVVLGGFALLRLAGGDGQGQSGTSPAATGQAGGQQNDPASPAPDPYAWPGDSFRPEWPADLHPVRLPTRDEVALEAVVALFDHGGTRRLDLTRIACRDVEYWRFASAVDRAWTQYILGSARLPRTELRDFPAIVLDISKPDEIRWIRPQNSLGIHGEEILVADVRWRTKPEVPEVREVSLGVAVQGPTANQPDTGWCFREFTSPAISGG